MDQANTKTTPIPEPYLGSLFESGVEPVIATGFNYHTEEIAIHGVESHGAIDFDLPRGTKILAPADGYYIATYGEILLRNDDGSARTLSLDQALKGNPRNTDLNPPGKKGAYKLYFGTFLIQGWHTRGRYTQYGHIDWANPEIPYYPPEVEHDEHGKATGNLKHSTMLRASVDDYHKPGIAAFIRAGEVIAEVGMTGCGWNKRCYDTAKFDRARRPDFRHANYTYYTEPHLHFVAFGRRAPYTRDAHRFDPFGIYGEMDAGYPKTRAQWPKQQPQAKHQPLWLAQS